MNVMMPVPACLRKGVTSSERKSEAVPLTDPVKVMCPTIWGPGDVPLHYIAQVKISVRNVKAYQ